MEKFFNAFFLFFFLCFISCISFAQPPEADLSALEKYKNYDFFYFHYSEHVEITADKKNIITSSHTNKVFCFNNYVNTAYNDFDVVYNTYFSEIKNFEAVSYSPENGKYKKKYVKDLTPSSYSTNSVFDDSYRQLSFTLPAVKNGTIGKLQYDEINSEPHFAQIFYFRHFVPIAKSEFALEADNRLEIAYKFVGDTSGIRFEKISKGKKNIYKWTGENLPVIKKEDYMPSLNRVSPYVVCWIKTAALDNEIRNIDKDISSFGNWIYGISKNSLCSTLNDDAKKVVDSLKQITSSQYELGKKIYQYVQKNIKYIAFEEGMHGFVPHLPSEVLYKKYGDCKDKATLLSSLLNYAGIEARDALTGTYSIPMKFSEMPIPECANHMITAVKDNGKWKITDATDEHAHYLSVSEPLQGKEALVLVDSATSEIVPIPAMPYYMNGRLDSLDLRLENEKLLGKGKTYFFGYMKETVISRLENTLPAKKNDYYRALIDIGNNKTEYSSIDYAEMNDTAMVINYTFEIPNYVTRYENKLYFNPHVFKTGIVNDYNIDSSKIHPIDFKYQSFTSYVISFSLNGLSVDRLPENSSFDFSKFGYEIKYSSDGKKFTAAFFKKENCMELAKPDFTDYKKYYTHLSSALLENISFTKK